MNERIQRAVNFLGKCAALEGTEEHEIAQGMREQAMWARVKYNEYCRAGFSPKAAFALLLGEVSSPSIDIHNRGDWDDEGDSSDIR